MIREKRSQNRENSMTTVDVSAGQRAVRAWLEEIAGSRKPAESVKAMLFRLARTTGLSASRIKKYWYGETENIAWHEAETIRIKAEWAIIKRRQQLAAAMTDLKRTEDYGAEIARRREASRRADLDRAETQVAQQFHFWLGRPDSDLD